MTTEFVFTLLAMSSLVSSSPVAFANNVRMWIATVKRVLVLMNGSLRNHTCYGMEGQVSAFISMTLGNRGREPGDGFFREASLNHASERSPHRCQPVPGLRPHLDLQIQPLLRSADRE